MFGITILQHPSNEEPKVVTAEGARSVGDILAQANIVVGERNLTVDGVDAQFHTIIDKSATIVLSVGSKGN